MDLSSLGFFVIYLIYGLSFIVMGVTVFMYRGRTAKVGIANTIWLLGAFGFSHGAADLVDAALRLGSSADAGHDALEGIRLILLIVSFVFLAQFGLVLLIRDRRTRHVVVSFGALGVLGVVAGLSALFFSGSDPDSFGTAERLSRWLFGLPGGLASAAGIGLMAQRCKRMGMRECVVDASILAAGLAAYSILAGGIPSGHPEPNMLLGLPIQLYRMIAAIVVTVGCVSLLSRLAVDRSSEGSTGAAGVSHGGVVSGPTEDRELAFSKNAVAVEPESKKAPPAST